MEVCMYVSPWICTHRRNLKNNSKLCYYLALETLNPNKVPQLSPNITANVVVNTFNSLTFQWKTSNNTSSNETLVYLITLRTFDKKMSVEEKVLGLVSKFSIFY